MRRVNIKQKLYIISMIIIISYYIVGLFLSPNIYYKPIVTFMVLILQFVDFFIVPLLYTGISIKKDEKNFFMRMFLYLVSIVGITILSVVITIVLLIIGKDIIYGDIHYEENGRINVAYRPWLESSDWIEVYENKGIFFVENIDGYKDEQLY